MYWFEIWLTKFSHNEIVFLKKNNQKAVGHRGVFQQQTMDRVFLLGGLVWRARGTYTNDWSRWLGQEVVCNEETHVLLQNHY